MENPRQQQPSTAERAARWAVLVFLVLATVTLAFGLGYGVKDLQGDGSSKAPQNTAAVKNGSNAALIDEILNVLQTQYVDRKNLNVDALKDSAIDGIIASLNDRETHYIPQADVKAGALDFGATYQGIGAVVSDRSGSIQIVSPYRDSPAEKAGVQAGDIILEVNGDKTDGWTQDQAVEKIRGTKGTTVTLTVKHTNGQVQTVTVTRGEIQIESVFTEPNLEVIPGESGKKLVDRTGKEASDIAYVNISTFHQKTPEELRQKMADVESKGYKGLIVDLRSNPGGYLDSTVSVADEFLNKGTIITEVDGNGTRKSTSATTGGILTNIPVVVLIDAGSASGAEVLAASLRDNGRATIVGTRSYGKGTVNIPVTLKACGDPEGCGALYLAISRWLTPKGDQIEGLGIKPDVEVPMKYEDYVDQGDLQVFKAIDVLRGVQ